MPFQIDIVRSTDELQTLAPDWAALWDRDRRATPFQHPAWLLPWWHHFGQPDLRAVTLRHPESRALLGLLPLYVYREPGSGERQLLLMGAGTSDYLDAVAAPECTAADVAEALRAALAEDTWDAAYFTQLRPGSLVVDAIQCLEFFAVESFAGEATSRCAAVPVSGLPAKLRKQVLFCRNAAIAHGRLELVAATAETIPAAFEQLVATHTARWQEAGEAGVLADPAVLAWHREALPLLEAAGLLRLMTLRLGNEAVATMYSLVDPPGRADRTQYLYLMGYDLAREALQPGQLLTAYTVERAANEGIEIVDMLRGDETYKRFWHVQRVPTHGYALRRTLHT